MTCDDPTEQAAVPDEPGATDNAPAPQHMSKSAFILSQPRDIPAAAAPCPFRVFDSVSEATGAPVE